MPRAPRSAWCPDHSRLGRGVPPLPPSPRQHLRIPHRVPRFWSSAAGGDRDRGTPPGDPPGHPPRPPPAGGSRPAPGPGTSGKFPGGPGAGARGRPGRPRRPRGAPGAPGAPGPPPEGSPDPPFGGPKRPFLGPPRRTVLAENPPFLGARKGPFLGPILGPRQGRAGRASRGAGGRREGRACTFLRVFNNSPSRDRCWDRFRTPLFWPFLTPPGPGRAGEPPEGAS